MVASFANYSKLRVVRSKFASRWSNWWSEGVICELVDTAKAEGSRASDLLCALLF